MKVGLIGCGSIGSTIAKYFDKDKDIVVDTVYDVKRKKADELTKELSRKPYVARNFDDFMSRGWELAVEAASQEAVKKYGEYILEKGDLMLMSVGSLADDRLKERIERKALENNRKVYVPNGAIGGTDALKSAAIGRIDEVQLTTTKSPKSLGRKDLKRVVIYKGTAREAAQKFPKNINVAETLSLAGVGPDKTKVILVSDPEVATNTHEVYAKGEFGELYAKTSNKPSPTNPKTSYLAALSAIKTLETLIKPIKVM